MGDKNLALSNYYIITVDKYVLQISKQPLPEKRLTVQYQLETYFSYGSPTGTTRPRLKVSIFNTGYFIGLPAGTKGAVTLT
jgi:hypothetical protein